MKTDSFTVADFHEAKVWWKVGKHGVPEPVRILAKHAKTAYVIAKDGPDSVRVTKRPTAGLHPTWSAAHSHSIAVAERDETRARKAAQKASAKCDNALANFYRVSALTMPVGT